MKRSEVKEYNGQNGKPAYIIFDNKIYDVTDSKLWKDGVHMNRHKAGEDMTDFISMAPHGESLLERDNIKFIGNLEEEKQKEDKKSKYRRLYGKFHPHPMFIHFPMGILYFGAFMLLLYLFTGNISFESASYYALIVGTISIFPTVLSGFISWWLNYEMTMTNVFKNKIVFSAILIVISLILIIIRSNYLPPHSMNYILEVIYVGGYFLCLPILSFIAFNGGKITWPS